MWISLRYNWTSETISDGHDLLGKRTFFADTGWLTETSVERPRNCPLQRAEARRNGQKVAVQTLADKRMARSQDGGQGTAFGRVGKLKCIDIKKNRLHVIGATLTRTRAIPIHIGNGFGARF